jgi:hypothetical protein
MHKVHRADRCADVTRALCGLIDATSVDLDLNGVRTGEAAEESHFHIGNDGRGADDKALDADKFVGDW